VKDSGGATEQGCANVEVTNSISVGRGARTSYQARMGIALVTILVYCLLLKGDIQHSSTTMRDVIDVSLDGESYGNHKLYLIGKENF